MLSLGSGVYLKDGNQPILIIGRGQVITVNDTQYFCDYTGCPFPNGINQDGNLCFNEENIDEVLFEGFYNETEERYVSLLEREMKETTIEKLNVMKLLDKSKNMKEQAEEILSEGGSLKDGSIK